MFNIFTFCCYSFTTKHASWSWSRIGCNYLTRYIYLPHYSTNMTIHTVHQSMSQQYHNIKLPWTSHTTLTPTNYPTSHTTITPTNYPTSQRTLKTPHLRQVAATSTQSINPNINNNSCKSSYVFNQIKKSNGHIDLLHGQLWQLRIWLMLKWKCYRTNILGHNICRTVL